MSDNISPESIPPELRELRQWVCWRYEDRGGKQTKVPISAVTGREADCTDRSEFAGFQQALTRFRRYQDLSGIGFVFSDGDPFTGIDIDDCISESGELSELAQSILRRFPGTYAEVSPSGTGCKLWLRGSLPIPPDKTGRKIPKLGIETYCRGRYFTVTGQRLQGTPAVVRDLHSELQVWFAELFQTAKSDDKTDKTPAAPVSATVQEIVEKASAARNGDRFRRLWGGDCSDFGDDHSSGDLALCSMLAFWCGGDSKLIDECFQASGLMREKWEREDYRQTTIQKAVSGCTEFYSWDRQSQSGVSSVLSSTSAEPPEAWPDLIPLTGPEPEPIQPSDFPDCVGGIIHAVMAFAEVPAELPALMALGVLATAAQKKFCICGEGAYTEPLSLFVCPAMPPGERKTAVVNVLTAPLRRWESEERARLGPVIREEESQRRTAERRIEHLRGKAAKCDSSVERDDLQREIDAIERELPPQQAMPLLTVDDCTPEHVATLLSRHGERLAIISDEGGIFDIVAGRYSRGVPNLDVFLQGHAGSPVRVHRGSRDPVDLRSPCLTVAVSCQPFVLQEMGENKAFRGRGLLSRFLFAIPKSRLGYRSLTPRDIPAAIADRWARTVCGMLSMEQKRDDFGEPVAAKLHLSPDAHKLWKAEQQATEIEMRPGGPWAGNTGWASKFPGAVLRIAGVLHVAVCADSGRHPAVAPVTASVMQSAVQVGRKIKTHTAAAFGMMALTEDQKFAHKIVDWIRRDSVTAFTGRECAIHCNSAGSVQELAGAFEILTNHGWIRQGEKRKPDGGGRPSQPFEVNPAVTQLDDNTDKTNQTFIGHGVSSVLSSVPASAEAHPAESEPVQAGDVDDYEFSFPGEVPF